MEMQDLASPQNRVATDDTSSSKLDKSNLSNSISANGTGGERKTHTHTQTHTHRHTHMTANPSIHFFYMCVYMSGNGKFEFNSK